MVLNTSELFYTLSDALDYVEHSLFGVTTCHSKRIAYLSAQMGRVLGLDNSTLIDLSIRAALHDNALTEFMQTEAAHGSFLLADRTEINFAPHCRMGEQNIRILPARPAMENAILYHHELADGSGPFGLCAKKTPLGARIIHLADKIDLEFDLSHISHKKYEKLCVYLRQSIGTQFDAQVTDAFFAAFPFEEMHRLCNKKITRQLQTLLPTVVRSYTNEELIAIATFFARIIDYKSAFTCSHSRGIAEKACRLGAFLGYDAQTQAQLYLAGGLHDIGKLAIPSSILEKPGALTDAEFEQMKRHAALTTELLSRVSGLEEIAGWAAYHHEKLDGSGYPLGLTAAQLTTPMRMMAVADVYQALIESRPYKQGMPHSEAIRILREMAAAGKVDAGLVEDANLCFGTAHAAV